MATQFTYTIQGTVCDLSGKRLAGLAVRVYVNNKPVGNLTQTSESGDYQLEGTLEDLRKAGISSDNLTPDIRVFAASGELLHKQSLPENPPQSLDCDLTVSLPSEKMDFRIHGRVREADSKRPIAGLTIRLVQRKLRESTPLATGKTSHDGSYALSYQVERADAADLSIEITATRGKKDELYSSGPLHSISQDMQHHIRVADMHPNDTVWESMIERVQPHLGASSLADLEQDEQQDDVEFLSGKTGLAEGQIRSLSLSHRFAGISSVPAPFWHVVLRMDFLPTSDDISIEKEFALLRQAMPVLKTDLVLKKVLGAIEQKEIPAMTDKAIKASTQAFENFVLAQSLEKPASGKPTFTQQSLAVAGIKGTEKQTKVVRLIRENGRLNAKAIEILKKDEAFKATEINKLETHFKLGEILGNDGQMVDAIRGAFKISKAADIPKLAQKSRTEWTDFAAENVATSPFATTEDIPEIKGQDKIQSEALGTFLEKQFRTTFPTSSFVGGMKRAVQSNEDPAIKSPKKIEALLKRHPQLELHQAPIDNLVQSDQVLAKDPDFVIELKATQRLFKLNQDYETVDSLLADDIHSAQQIYRMGEGRFVQTYKEKPGFDEVVAKKIYNRAAETHAATVTLVGELRALHAAGEYAALSDTGSGDLTSGSTAAVTNFPNYENLFQTGDICLCEQCRSVYSPAAYFADLLMFLKDRKAINPSDSLKDLLFTRRPDLGYLELNCDNAHVTLPYIDVVNEVLEDVVAAGAYDLNLSLLPSINADPDIAKADILVAFAAHDIDLDENLHLAQIGSSDNWVVHTSSITYLLRWDGGPNYFAEILRNTKASADELRANPAYVNPEAYQVLKGAQYPMALPFDLFGEETRTSFAKAKVNRWDLMEVLHGDNPPNDPSELEIAAEYFGIGSDSSLAQDELRIITQADAAGQNVFWGEADNAAMLANFNNVKAFVVEAKLDYNQLLQLLDFPYINPDGDLQIVHLDASCDLDQKEISNLTAADMDRMHRFLRMWRKTSLEMWELEMLIRQTNIGGGQLNGDFLIQLMHFLRLQKELGRKADVEEVAALFENINSETRFSELHKTRHKALYQQLFLNEKYIQPLDEAFEVAAVDVANSVETISGHSSVVLAAMRIKQDDLDVYLSLPQASDGNPYIADELTLSNLSFVYRHAWLAKTLKLKAEEWAIALKVFATDYATFVDPATAMSLIESVRAVDKSGLKWEQVDYVLTANPDSDAALEESATAKFLLSLRASLQEIEAEFDPAQFDYLQAAPPTDSDSLSELLGEILTTLARGEGDLNTIRSIFLGTIANEAEVSGLPVAFEFPEAITDVISISYNEENGILRFIGSMTNAERSTLLTDAALAAVTGLSEYQDAIEDLYWQPRLLLKFFQPEFETPLTSLPEAIDFATQLDEDLAVKISFDAERQMLHLNGFLSAYERTALEALSAEADYVAALAELYDLPRNGVFDSAELWMEAGDFAMPLDEDNLAENLATACTDALNYLTVSQKEAETVNQLSAALGLSTAMVGHVVADWPELHPGQTMLAHFTDTLAATDTAVEYATHKDSFDTYTWLSRLASLILNWRIDLPDLEWLTERQAVTLTFDLTSLPVDDGDPAASADTLISTQSLLNFRKRIKEEEISLFELLGNLADGEYANAAEFAADVEVMTDEKWLADDVEAFIADSDLADASDLLLAANLERLERAMYFVRKLDTDMATLLPFGAATMGEDHASDLRDILRNNYGPDSWLTLSTEIQDVLRERKRDSLVAWHLAEGEPADVPSGKWENSNDVYAYYLLDVEMSSCFLTSRLVQASGSVQLYVQRCMMGLEPEVRVDSGGDDGDSAWDWWAWMRKYRVWEANRKVFLYPENWIEPELRIDKSSFFADLENELLQNELNEFTIEDAFVNYLDKLNNVAQLEIAGFFHEDDGDEAIFHVFGRTGDGEPHSYFYRTYDYRQWTPWEKVELEIQGDHLVPVVVNKRVMLFWPVMMELPDEEANNTQTVAVEDEETELANVRKYLQLKLAGSEYRNGTWTPARTSTEYARSTYAHVGAIERYALKVFAIDQSKIDKDFGIRIAGSFITENGYWYGIDADFQLYGCKGLPELADINGYYTLVATPDESELTDLRHYEVQDRYDAPQNDLTMNHANILGLLHMENFQLPILFKTPNIFKTNMSWAMSYLDKLVQDLSVHLGGDNRVVPVGSWLPYFYADKHRTFMVLPVIDFTFGNDDQEPQEGGMIGLAGGQRYYYPEIKGFFKELHEILEGLVRSIFDGLDLSALSTADRLALEIFIGNSFGSTGPYTDTEVIDLLVRFIMRIFDFALGTLSLFVFNFRRHHFKNFYHPLVCSFSKMVNNPEEGIDGLMTRAVQMQQTSFRFFYKYLPTPLVLDWPESDEYPIEEVDFSPDGAYSSYNWELFYHAPLMIANRLSQDQQFEQAMKWYHYIFNPIGVEGILPDGSQASAPQKYWITKPFFLTTDEDYQQQRIDSIMRMIAGDATVDGFTATLKTELESAVQDWRNHPFEPHRIAAYRTVAYQKTVFMKYLDNLVAWGDYLFRQDSMESINEATQLYILAAELLGPRPYKVPPAVEVPVETFNELEDDFDDFSNALIQVENFVPAMSGSGSGSSTPIPMLYFCIPKNEKLQGYYDTIADRLHKIRNCMNIDGVVRSLSLFEPPIDPGALVKAVAGGMNLSAALADMNAPLPFYRFEQILARSKELVNDLKALSSSLLSALEKKDAEELSLLRQSQEIKVADAVIGVRELQISELEENKKALELSKATIEVRRDYYQQIDYLNSQESLQIDKLQQSHNYQEAAQGVTLAASIISLLPNIDLGISGVFGSPVAEFVLGGLNLGQASKLAADILSFLSTMAANDATMAGIRGGHDRRWDDWKHQENVANAELDHMDQQIAAMDVRIQIAEKELKNQKLSLENSEATEDFMKSKYTNKDLYQWMIGQTSQTYFQTYQLAYDMAKRAERCYRFELGISDSSFISFGYWNSLKKGLLSGDKLQFDLRRLEADYLEQNKREFELTKHISLSNLNPLALIQLRETGQCFFSAPEEIFDLDYPGHYFRRIKSVSISLPCVAGPYTTVSATLRLLNNHIRVETGIADGYAHNNEDGVWVDDTRFTQQNIPTKSIAASNAQQDSGMFQLNFQDARYLPFEGAGAISDWKLELFNDPLDNNPGDPDWGRPLRQFDYDTITDAIVHIRYTAREDAGTLKNAAVTHLREYYDTDDGTPQMRVLNLKQSFPNAWHRMQNPVAEEDGNVMSFTLSRNLFPYRDGLQNLKVNSLHFFAKASEMGDYEVTMNPPIPPVGDDDVEITMAQSEAYGNLHFAERDTIGDGIELDFRVAFRMDIDHHFANGTQPRGR